MVYGVLVRVKPEVEELVRKVAERLGYETHTVRNVAILLGLAVLSLRIPESDDDFLNLLRLVQVIVCGEEGEERNLR